MKISLIASIGKNNELGFKNQLIWHLPDDLKNFKKITSGHTIVMGKKTYESIGKPLPNRNNIILARDYDYKADGCVVAHSIEEVLDLIKNEDETFIIGGGEIYKLFLPLANKLYLTQVNASLEADTYFPKFNLKEWKRTSCIEHGIDERHCYSFIINTYEKIK